ncbi:MAG: response regulator [Nannocystaceae bacterium]|nr:response regulator [Nannocystaceae bacterium]
MATILVDDDDDLVADLLRAVLERAGMQVVVHTSGFGLALAVKQHRPDLVVLDVNMPGLSGVQAVRAMRALDPAYGIDAPVLLHSGLPNAELEELARQTGARGWLRKPARAAETVAAVQRALGVA